MNRIYTAYVSSLDESLFEEVWRRLRADLRAEMRRRGLWTAPPSFLGLPGHTWEDALEDLLQECYLFTFVERLKNLRHQLTLRDNVDGLVVRNVRNFLTGLQRKADPIGYRVFGLLQRAILGALDDEALLLLAGDERIRNDSVLGFDRRTPPEEASPELGDHVRSWNDELLPELITARSRSVTKVVLRLTELVVGLADDGVAPFRFKDLVDPMKRDVRDRWSAVWADTVEVEPESGDEEKSVVLVVPAFDPLNGFQDFHRCVSGKIDACEEKRTPREELWKLWRFLQSRTTGEEERRRLSYVRLSALLGIYRERLPRLSETLLRFMEWCRSGQDGGQERNSGLLPEGERR